MIREIGLHSFTISNEHSIASSCFPTQRGRVGAEPVAHLVGCVPSVQEALSSIRTTQIGHDGALL